jgi:hypothetical protein
VNLIRLIALAWIGFALLRVLAAVSWLVLFWSVGRAGVLHAATFTMAQGERPVAWAWPNLRLSLWFTVPVIGIVATHEAGHWWAARVRGMRTIGPFALPLHAPWLAALHIHGVPRIGVGGAFLWLRNTGTPAQRFDVAFAGLFWGFCVSLACALIGAWLSPVYHGHAAAARFWTPSLLSWLTAGRSWHPLVVASWVGFLLTSANLLPVWPLDGWRVISAPWSVWRTRPWQAGVLASLVLLCWV